MEKIYIIEGTRQGEYFRTFVNAASENEAIKKWENADRFQDRIGKENFKKYRNITARETSREDIPSDLIY